MSASTLLLVLGLVALAGAVNGVRPARNTWAVLLSWPASLAALELAGELVALSGVAALVLVAAGGLSSATGWVGLVALLVADAIAIRGLVSSRRMPLTFGGAARVLPATPAISRYPRSHAALPTRVARRPGVRRARDVVYARPDGTPLKLDICRPALPSPRPLPAIVQVHGGGFVTGSRREALPLVTHLAANGWTAFSIDYRLSPRATFPDHLVDVKRAIAWVRENADAYGVDPSFVAVTGGSAGATLAALAALTANDETLQPGFEDGDTSVAALVASYGVYDLLDDRITELGIFARVLERFVFKARRRDAPDLYRAASPIHHVHPGAPPALIIHGTGDSVVPAAFSQRFAAHLGEVSRNPVHYAEVAGAQHAFDAIPSWRTIAVVEAVERFLAAILETPAAAGVRSDS